MIITATDIGYYLQNREKMFESMKFFEKNNATKRRALLSILMIMCNLCDTVKPWDEYLATVVRQFYKISIISYKNCIISRNASFLNFSHKETKKLNTG